MLFKVILRYSFFLIMILVTMAINLISKNIGGSIISSAFSSFLQMLTVLPPIMLMLGLMDEWISRETMIKYMGKKSGILGIGLALLMASIAAGPMYAAFPFAALLIKKGVKLSNIIIFMNAWCVTKISTLTFELTSLGYKFTLLRLAINLPGIMIMGYMTQLLCCEKDFRKDS